MSNFTISELRALKRDIGRYSVDEGRNLGTVANDYLLSVSEAVGFTIDTMTPGEPTEFVLPAPPEGAEAASKWLRAWKARSDAARQSTSSQGTSVQGRAGAGAQPSPIKNKRPAQQPAEGAPAPKRTQSSFTQPIITFHVQELLKLLKGRDEIAQSVLLLQQALRMVGAGADPKLVEWHLKHIKKELPNEDEIVEAVDLLTECIRFRDA